MPSFRHATSRSLLWLRGKEARSISKVRDDGKNHAIRRSDEVKITRDLWALVTVHEITPNGVTHLKHLA